MSTPEKRSADDVIDDARHQSVEQEPFGPAAAPDHNDRHVLVYLVLREASEPLFAQEVADRLDKSYSTVYGWLKALVADGFASEKPSLSNGGVVFYVTESSGE